VSGPSRSQSRVAVFGEGVHLLWAKGNAEAAIQVEKLGNLLVKRYDVDKRRLIGKHYDFQLPIVAP